MTTSWVLKPIDRLRIRILWVRSGASLQEIAVLAGVTLQAVIYHTTRHKLQKSDPMTSNWQWNLDMIVKLWSIESHKKKANSGDWLAALERMAKTPMDKKLISELTETQIHNFLSTLQV